MRVNFFLKEPNTMTTKKGPIYTILGIAVGVVILLGGAAKLYRATQSISSGNANQQVRDLLGESDKAVEAANQGMGAVFPSFQKLLGDFDASELSAFRQEQANSAANIKADYLSINDKLQMSLQKIAEATKLGVDPQLGSFLEARSGSYKHLIQVNLKNKEIVEAIMDPSMSDRAAILDKIVSIVASRDVEQKAYEASAANADGLLRNSRP